MFKFQPERVPTTEIDAPKPPVRNSTGKKSFLTIPKHPGDEVAVIVDFIYNVYPDKLNNVIFDIIHSYTVTYPFRCVDYINHEWLHTLRIALSPFDRD